MTQLGSEQAGISTSNASPCYPGVVWCGVGGAYVLPKPPLLHCDMEQAEHPPTPTKVSTDQLWCGQSLMSLIATKAQFCGL